MLASLFKGLRGLLVILVWGAVMIAVDQTNPGLIDGLWPSLVMYATFLVLALTWLYYGTGQHLKPEEA
jgi:low temperature requirement protein LtrA